MKRPALILMAATALAFAGTAQADPPSRVTIVAVFEPITYGENAFVNGQLLGDNQGGQTVALEQSAAPFTDWTPVAQTTADAAGYYSFKLHPSQTLQYRTNSQGLYSEKSVQVSVAPRIALAAASAGRTSIRFSGRFAPALEGQSVAIQRRDSNGSWTTVASARLRSGKTFEGRLRARRKTTLRAFFATDGAHLDGFSNSVTVTPGTRARAAAASCARPRIVRVSTTPASLLAGQGFSLRTAATITSGRVYAIDVLWGDGDARDHFTLAPALRKPKVTFTLRHRYKDAGTFRPRVRVYGVARGCKSSADAHPQLAVGSA